MMMAVATNGMVGDDDDDGDGGGGGDDDGNNGNTLCNQLLGVTNRTNLILECLIREHK